MLIEILQTYNPYKTKPRNPPILKILIQTKNRVTVRLRREIETTPPQPSSNHSNNQDMTSPPPLALQFEHPLLA